MHTLDHVIPLPFASHFSARALAVAAENDADNPRAASDELSDLESRVCEGLRSGEFHLVFQGAYQATGDAASSALARLEAQVRWVHPDYGLLLPGAFMMPLEHPQVALEMATFVVDSVCHELRACLAAQLPVQPVAINVPAQVAVLEGFADHVELATKTHGVPPELLHIEVADSADAAKLLGLHSLTAGLRDLGVGISLGKWGNGASSLAALGTLDVDTVTIAPELMAKVPRDKRAAVVMAGLIGLLQALEVRVVVGGVDSDAQRQWLSGWPDVLVQGRLFGRAQADLATIMATQREIAAG
ncbi:EAL domain-containing protein [Paraburkholderia sp. BCC1886]|uniref:EAL domain-containing protein n=1 Tax=Paraburkholderia sp. BCC1886 TaxID=2562670 RepID=UPI001181CB50|nr:EAL domain-containing protein [Paraburkholderia sp. BCC1886]